MNRNTIILIIFIAALLITMYVLFDRQKRVESQQMALNYNQKNIAANQVEIALTMSAQAIKKLEIQNCNLKETIHAKDELIKRLN